MSEDTRNTNPGISVDHSNLLPLVWVCGLTSAVSGEVEQQDVGAEAAQVVEGLQVLLQFPVGQFGLQDGRQVTEHVGVQRRRPEEADTQTINQQEP